MRWIASAAGVGVGIGVYYLVGILSRAEPIVVRGAWGVVAAVVVVLITRLHDWKSGP